MNKIQKTRLTICLAKHTMLQFKEVCKTKDETMTEVLKRFIKNYIKTQGEVT